VEARPGAVNLQANNEDPDIDRMHQANGAAGLKSQTLTKPPNLSSASLRDEPLRARQWIHSARTARPAA
jgi:hypothetical protein